MPPPLAEWKHTFELHLRLDYDAMMHAFSLRAELTPQPGQTLGYRRMATVDFFGDHFASEVDCAVFALVQDALVTPCTQAMMDQYIEAVESGRFIPPRP